MKWEWEEYYRRRRQKYASENTEQQDTDDESPNRTRSLRVSSSTINHHDPFKGKCSNHWEDSYHHPFSYAKKR